VKDPSIVDHDVNTAKMFLDPQEGGQDVLLLGYVALHWVQFPLLLLQIV